MFVLLALPPPQVLRSSTGASTWRKYEMFDFFVTRSRLVVGESFFSIPGGTGSKKCKIRPASKFVNRVHRFQCQDSLHNGAA